MVENSEGGAAENRPAGDDHNSGRDLNEWLRSVRPATTADDGWTDSPDAARVIAEVHRRTAIGRGRRPKVKRTVWLPALAAACLAALIAGITLAPGSKPPQPRAVAALPAPVIRPAAMLLSTESSCANLLGSLREHTAASVGEYGLPGVRYGTLSPGYFQSAAGLLPMASSAAAAGSGSANPADTSTTNDQETGVDEPDVVKADGNRVLTMTDGVLRVLDAATRKVAGSLDLTQYDGWRGAQLLATGNHALVLLGSQQNYPASPRSTYLFVDLTAAPKVTGSVRASGNYLDARLVGNEVRLVVRSTPTINFPTQSSTAANQKIARRAPLAAWAPQYTTTVGTQTTEQTVPCSQISHPPKYTGASLLTIYSLDLSNPASPERPVTVAGDGNTVYATTDSLYIATNPGWFCCGPTSGQQTQLHRFDITGATTYLGSATVPGRLLSQYSLSEYGGSLRIATTGGTGSAATSSSLYVLDAASLTVTGHVGGLGKNERIYAVRFLGPRAYVVTFRQTDPLYVLDLSDPRRPRVTGNVQLDGYSDYLHDAGDSRLIGVGQGVAANRIAGLQVSLFDVRNPAQPKRVARVIRSDGANEGPLDPHAFLYWQPTGLTVVPLVSWTSQTESGSVLVLKVSGGALTTIGTVANPTAVGIPDDGLGIQRSLIVDGALWTVSGSGVQISEPATLTRQAWVPFG